MKDNSLFRFVAVSGAAFLLLMSVAASAAGPTAPASSVSHVVSRTATPAP
ncbi:hypothetical protein [Oleisolibacter albus]|nr:hypothetical protein [Oleisolibacter albus]